MKEKKVVEKEPEKVLGSETLDAPIVVDVADVADKGLKKKYKRIIKSVLDENGNKMKRKKLKKEVINRAAELDESDDIRRG